MFQIGANAAAAPMPPVAVAVAGAALIYGAWQLGEWIAEQPWNPLTQPVPFPGHPGPIAPNRPLPGRPAQPLPPPPTIQMAKGGRKNIQNEISDDMKRRFGGDKDLICKFLEGLYNCSDSATKQKIKVAQKYFGCRRSGGGGR